MFHCDDSQFAGGIINVATKAIDQCGVGVLTIDKLCSVLSMNFQTQSYGGSGAATGRM